MAILTVYNRYRSEPFVGMHDGQEYVIPDKLALLDYIARHLKKQSILKRNPVTGEELYRLAIIEDGDEDSEIKMLPKESLDRTDMDMPDVEYVTIRNPAPKPVPRGSGRFDSIKTGTASN